MTFIIGLTGGIGSGKTAASDHFAQLGIDVVDADVVAREVVEPGSPALKAIAEHFGADTILPSGALNRPLLRQKVFEDPEQRLWLEQLTHPLIREQIRHKLEQAQSPYVLLVSPLLIESGQSEFCQHILLVDVPEDLQLSRAAARDNNTPDQGKAIMAAQASRQQRLKQADDVITNDSTLEALHRQVEQQHQHYLALANGDSN